MSPEFVLIVACCIVGSFDYVCTLIKTKNKNKIK